MLVMKSFFFRRLTSELELLDTVVFYGKFIRRSMATIFFLGVQDPLLHREPRAASLRWVSFPRNF